MPVAGSTSCPLSCCVLVRHSHRPLKCLYQPVSLCLKQTHSLCVLHSHDGLPSCRSFGHSAPPLGLPRTGPSPRQSRGATGTPALDAAVFSESHVCIPGSSRLAGRFAALGFGAKRSFPRRLPLPAEREAQVSPEQSSRDAAAQRRTAPRQDQQTLTPNSRGSRCLHGHMPPELGLPKVSALGETAVSAPSGSAAEEETGPGDALPAALAALSALPRCASQKPFQPA